MFRHTPATALAHEAIPHTGGVDCTLALLAEGYRFIPRRCDAFGSDIFATRLMLRPAICVRGEDAARMFYTPGRFTRRGAIPPTTLMLLQDYGSAATLDGQAHRVRKAMLMSLMDEAGRARLVDLAGRYWQAAFARWGAMRQVVLHRAAEAVLCRAACAWAGVPLTDTEGAARTAEFSAMIDGAGSAGPRNWKGLLMRAATERWARMLVQAARRGDPVAPPGSPLQVLAHHVEADGQPIRPADAQVELINLLRPTVAVARYVVFGALAMHQHPEWRARLAGGDDLALAMFVHEVRRFYPFFPAVGGRACEDFEWLGMHFEKGSWVLLDLYGTNHHPATWDDPGVFRPERFAGWQGSGFDLVPQGGGDYFTGHRCAGELATIDLVKSAMRLLAGTIDYRVPPQDLRVRLSRMPTLPASGFVIDSVRPRA